MAMAFFGHMGIEWNLLKEPDEALAKLAVWVAEFKKHRDWVRHRHLRARRLQRSGRASGRYGDAEP